MRPCEWTLFRRWRRRAAALLPDRARILEVGAGPGMNAPFYREGMAPVVSDISVAMVREARRGAAFPVLAADAESLPFAGSTFDAILGTLVFCNVPDDRAGLAELRRVLRPGGTLVLLEHVRPESRALGAIFDLAERLTGPAGEHVNRRTAENVSMAGFEIDRVENVLGTVIRLIAARRP